MAYNCFYISLRMSKLVKPDAAYSKWIQELKDRYRRSQVKAATQVNREMLRFYWSLGRDIVARDAENVYGSGFYRNLSQDLKAAIPEAEGFSRQNLQYMRKCICFTIWSLQIANRLLAILWMKIYHNLWENFQRTQMMLFSQFHGGTIVLLLISFPTIRQ